ncbi:MAG: Gfo/Idh/MocA family oxidoreductase [Planctomycetota bacterium]
MAQPVSILLVGVGGYGKIYLSALLDQPNEARFQLVGVVDPLARNSAGLDDLHSRGVPIHASLPDFYRRQHADLAVITAPIHRHCEQTCLALEQGSFVLCEKPPAATVQEVDRMIETSGRTGRWVAVGYQWSYTEPIQQLKQDIQAGLFGTPRRLKTLCLWPRDESYYHRNTWAGRVRHDQGEWVLDSPANNAMAHFLHNALYLLGSRADTSAEPIDIVAELYRANEIENFDTAAMRIHTAAGAEILFYGSHAVVEELGPVCSYEFTKATIECAGLSAPIQARFNDGSVKHYASPEGEPHSRKLWACVKAVAEDAAIPCGLRAARSHTLCINGAQDSVSRIVDFPPALIHVRGTAPSRLTWVAGLPDVLRRCYTDGVLPSELSVPWARPGSKISLEGYRRFPGGGSPQGRIVNEPQ